MLGDRMARHGEAPAEFAEHLAVFCVQPAAAGVGQCPKERVVIHLHQTPPFKVPAPTQEPARMS